MPRLQLGSLEQNKPVFKIRTRALKTLAQEFYPAFPAAESEELNGLSQSLLKKSVPSNEFRERYFTNISLAYWYMDDGSIKSKLGTILNTRGFALSDIERLWF